MKLDPGRLASKCGNLPSMPAVCSELTKALQHPDSSVYDISDIIRIDPSLAARLLRLANSVFYGFPSEVGSLEQAVQLLGLREIRDLVLATSVIQTFAKIPPSLVNLESFWKHSVACGLASALVARERNQPEPERYFAAGLLHDIGRLAMFLGAPEESSVILERCEKENLLPCKVESEILGFDHATLGGELLRSWNLPRPLVQMVRCHHNPVKTSVPPVDIFIVHYADFICTTLELGDTGEKVISPLIPPPGLRNFVLEDERLVAFVEELEMQCEEVFPILRVDHQPAPSQAAKAESQTNLNSVAA